MSDIRYTQTNNVDQGDLRIQVIARGRNTPIDNAKISISYSGDPESAVEEVNTDASGLSESVTLDAPPLEYSMEPSETQPYAEYTIQVTAEGYRPINISGIEILSGEQALHDAPPLEYSMEPSETQPYAEYTIQVTAEGYRPINISGIEILSGEQALQEVRMDEEETKVSPSDNIVIPGHTLYEEYPPKIPESEIKPVTETGEIVLSRVVIPEFVVVHDGAPSDSTAREYYIRYRDYIKNVASSEIYATWPDATIRANVLAIMSFTLNRVYTEWYIEILSGEQALQEVRMDEEETKVSPSDNIVIPGHTLYEEYPPKIPESEIKPVTETGEIVLSRVVIPEFVVVHDGAPSDSTAREYYIRYRDYIKNVASSEIYATWPDATIRANVLAIMSFTLNRVYTEW